MGDCNSGHVCHNPQFSSFPVLVSDSGASSIGDSVSILGGMVDVHISTVSLVEQNHSEISVHSNRQNHSDSPWWPSQLWFPCTPVTTVCGSPSDNTIPLRSIIISTRIHLRWEAIPSAHIKARMQHFQASRIFRRGLKTRSSSKTTLNKSCV